MILALRRVSGWTAIYAYLMMGAVLYFRVLPGTDWHWPPDFHLTGYSAQSIAPFLEALSGRILDGYARVLGLYDRIFIVALACWMALVGWRGSGIRYFVVGLALVYAAIDLSENAALLRVIRADQPSLAMVDIAHHLTLAKFAALYLCALVLIVHLRRSV
ncbi:hypothetical protein Q4555_05715 [Octadecabacter sp. 1_MG-2023]|uniref:hypothetical protein n=1 Tax=unclassified Octadecabacter TaxID=196158 RepID=UPI001C09C999|nr:MULTISPECIES: hypothetical protein [unclassified Octadecabacter]MBU2994552.1 hypothetical protein [Octadecabacter sp. B2R22]MDO6734155.1 hypothetical protein [Octadecabacter sp. 1_MG-2023]